MPLGGKKASFVYKVIETKTSKEIFSLYITVKNFKCLAALVKCQILRENEKQYYYLAS